METLRRYLLVVLLGVLSLQLMSAQADVDGYTPLVREGSEWYYDTRGFDGKDHYILKFEGDSVIHGVTYKKLYQTVFFTDGRVYCDVLALMREEGRIVTQVWGNVLSVSGQRNIMFLYGLLGSKFDETGEYVVYDFRGLYQENDEELLKSFYDSWIFGEAVVERSVSEFVLANRLCYKLGHTLFGYYRSEGLLIEGVGCVADVPKNLGATNVASFNFGSGPTYNTCKSYLIWMKNANGEYEYLDSGALNHEEAEQIDESFFANDSVEMSYIPKVIESFSQKHLIVEGNEWCYLQTSPEEQFYYILRIEGDSLTYGIPLSDGSFSSFLVEENVLPLNYKKLIQERTFSDGHAEIRVLAYLREEERSVGKYYVNELWGNHYGYSNMRMRRWGQMAGGIIETGEYSIYVCDENGSYSDRSGVLKGELFDHFTSETDSVIVKANLNMETLRWECPNVTASGRDRHSYNIYYGSRLYGRIIEGIGFVPVDEQVTGDLASFNYPDFNHDGRRTQLVYMKNSSGEYDYLDETLLPNTSLPAPEWQQLVLRMGASTIDLTLPSGDADGVVEVYSMSGQCVARAVTHGGTAQLSTSGLAHGVYIVVYTDPHHRITRKVLIH